MYLVDTNILSESTKVAPDANVLVWLEANEPLMRISTVSIGEIHYGIELLANGKKQTELRKWLGVLRTRFAESILPVDAEMGFIKGCFGSARTKASGD
jgi:toxin FitB